MGRRICLAINGRITEFPRRARPGEAGESQYSAWAWLHHARSGLYKTFKLPWEANGSFRWEVYTSPTRSGFDGNTIADLSLPQDPFVCQAESQGRFWRFTSTQTPLNETKAGRVMQFALRYEF